MVLSLIARADLYGFVVLMTDSRYKTVNSQITLLILVLFDQLLDDIKHLPAGILKVLYLSCILV